MNEWDGWIGGGRVCIERTYFVHANAKLLLFTYLFTYLVASPYQYWEAWESCGFGRAYLLTYLLACFSTRSLEARLPTTRSVDRLYLRYLSKVSVEKIAQRCISYRKRFVFLKLRLPSDLVDAICHTLSCHATYIGRRTWPT